MKKIKVSDPLYPKNLTQNEKEALTDELYKIQTQIFDGVDRNTFYKYVIAPETYLTKIYLFKNRRNETVGFLTFHLYRVEVEKKGKRKKVCVVRTETGILEAYRGKAPIFSIVFRESLKCYLKLGFPEGYFVATPIHPVPFLIAQRSCKEIFPHPTQPTPPHIGQVLGQIAQSFGMERDANSGKFVVNVGWIVKQNEAKRQKIAESEDPLIRYYLAQNPGYAKGNGLLVISPGSLRNLIGSSWRLMMKRLRKRRHSSRRMASGKYTRTIFPSSIS
ncbi:MAG: hypothetical protein AAF570_22215 [Bacteroidota bacterium]